MIRGEGELCGTVRSAVGIMCSSVALVRNGGETYGQTETVGWQGKAFRSRGSSPDAMSDSKCP